MTPDTLLAVEWPAPPRVRAFCTTRRGGISQGPFKSLNLSASSGDDESVVAENVRRLTRAAGLPHAPRWPRQVHGARIIVEHHLGDAAAPEADAVWSTVADRVCSVRIADCLPVLLCDRDARCVAAAHAGWRGLAAGILENTVYALPAPAAALTAWLGPAIGPDAFEVGEEVRSALLDADVGATLCFRPSPRGRWLADLYALARRRLARVGVRSVHGGGWCTHGDGERFFSYRRDGATGRMAAGIWIASDG